MGGPNSSDLLMRCWATGFAYIRDSRRSGKLLDNTHIYSRRLKTNLAQFISVCECVCHVRVSDALSTLWKFFTAKYRNVNRSTHTLNGRRAHPHILLFTHHDALLANDAHLLESFLLCDAYISSELQCLRPKVYVLC